MKKIIYIDRKSEKIEFVNLCDDIEKSFQILLPIDNKKIGELIEKVKNENISQFYVGFEGKLDDSGQYSDIIEVLTALSKKEIKETYRYIYDTVCEKLDKEFIEKNYCDFKDDKCVCQRNAKSPHDTFGCCYEFEYTPIMKMPKDNGMCRYIENKQCKEKCLTCKLFTCKYLRKQGIYFDIEKMLLLSVFFNKKQKRIIAESFFCKEEEILDKLVKYAK